jgi:predicted transcriptional regulator
MSDPMQRTLADVMADLDASEADIAAGRIVPADEVHQAIKDRIDRLETALSGRLSRIAASRR